MFSVCTVCFSPVCDDCAAKLLCHCEHKQGKQVWATLQEKLKLIDAHRGADSKGEGVAHASELLKALSEKTNYPPQFITPMSRSLLSTPELSWRNATAHVNCLALNSCFVVYRVVKGDKEELGKPASVADAVALLLPAIHALQCPPGPDA